MSVIERTEIVEIPTITEEEATRREMLLRAAEVVEEQGWTTRVFYDFNTERVCLVGAVAIARYGKDEFLERLQDTKEGSSQIMDTTVRSASEDILGVPCAAAWGWNDRLLDRISSKNAGELVSSTLRAMANGKTFDEATVLPAWKVERWKVER